MSKHLRAPMLAAGVPLVLWLAWSLWPRPDNVVLVVIDTLRRDHLATYGYARQTAPFLDHLAQEGAVFDGLSPTSWTKPATASLLTGLHPLHHQAVGRLDALPGQVVTLAERLRDAGYRTLGISANGWISAPFGFDQGFDELLLCDSVGHAQDVNRELLPHLDDLRPPFFLYVHYIDPHAPYDPRTAWDGGTLPAALHAQGPVSVESLDAFSVRRRSPEFLARARDLYDGEIRGADLGLQELVRELKRRGLFENTILVVTSDHGEELEDHGRMSHGLSLYEEVVRVPLVLHAPHLFLAGRHGLASLLDVVPTLEDLLELRPARDRPGLDGVSQAAALRNEEAPAGMRPFLYHLDHVDGTALALARGRDKLVLGRSPYVKELFDLAADPRESRNLLLQSEERKTARLSADLAAAYNGYSRQAAPRRPASLNGDLRGQLASLGYAAPERTEHPRKIPRRIVPADLTPGGLLGWEGEMLPSCVDLAGPHADRHLLRGWNGPEPPGRWSEPTGVIVLGTPPGDRRAATLVLDGASYRPDTPRVTVSIEHRRLLDTSVPPGAFRLTAPVDRLPGPGAVIVEIATDPAFLPARQGMKDGRSLGLFLFSACLRPAGPPTAATAAR